MVAVRGVGLFNVYKHENMKYMTFPYMRIYMTLTTLLVYMFITLEKDQLWPKRRDDICLYIYMDG